MGIRINSAVVYGVKFTEKETAAYEKFMKGKSENWILMRFIEDDIAKSEKERGKKKVFHYYDVFFTMSYLKRSIKGKALHPYRPYWHGLSKKKLEAVEEDLYGETEKYLSSHGAITEAKGFSRKHIWLPHRDTESGPPNIFGYVTEENYAMDTDYALVDFLGFKESDKIITVHGQYPWELGTIPMNKKKTSWMTINGENMISKKVLPLNKENESIYEAILNFTGTRRDFIKKKKAIWDRYHGHLKPYKVYFGNGWHGTSFYFYQVEMLFQFLAKYVPAIRYDVMRLEKLLCYYWR